MYVNAIFVEQVRRSQIAKSLALCKYTLPAVLTERMRCGPDGTAHEGLHQPPLRMCTPWCLVGGKRRIKGKAGAPVSFKYIYEVVYKKNKGPPSELASIWPDSRLSSPAVITDTTDNVSGFLPPTDSLAFERTCLCIGSGYNYIYFDLPCSQTT